MPSPTNEKQRLGWRALGPGFVVAATGVGAGDLIAAAVAGQKFGLAVLWVVVLGAFFKAFLNEGVSRWQLATGSTLIEGWIRHLPRWVSWYFLAYLCFWGFLVAAALMSACGVAAHTLVPSLPIPVWAAIHTLLGAILVWTGKYALFESFMKTLIAAMFVIVIACAIWIGAPLPDLFSGLFLPSVPDGSAHLLLGVMGGVGGSATLLCYGYWIREKGWTGATAQRRTWFDLSSAYFITGIFGIALIIIAASAQPGDASGSALILALSERLGEILGPVGKGAFLIGFWCAVFSSLLGVWQGVPYLFSNYMHEIGKDKSDAPINRSKSYRGFLLFLAIPPLVMLFFQRPLAIVILYAVAGAFFMPFLASVLLIMNNNKAWVGEMKNRLLSNIALICSLILFGALFAFEIARRFF
ncbi:Nramp family divalent metal transporter [Pelagicoccus mobilis]|uniref:Nramp family divalent metal transporter n=1 Tax=Pelagicoccus mobilis TaxID=415221 RepID=A0A934S1X1_9BACT|nr:Nramp family divalent metal transporter [Pelagicoccus mobilis]MBK1877578.1 Nramp family divalent metal transporter [Pelagicoccus mobilis]